MTSGGLMQLVAYGAQDVYLTANPQVTFFKQLYRRHSNFAMESIEQTFNGVANFGKRVTCTIARNGDLISKIYLQATLPCVDGSDLSNNTFSWVDKVGAALIRSVEVEIGGQSIDKHYGDWLNIWSELTREVGKKEAWTDMVSGGTDIGKNASIVANNTVDGSRPFPTPCETCATGCRSDATAERTLYIPLEFWFNRHTGLALPLIALQYHEVKINLEFNTLNYLCNITTDASGNAFGSGVSTSGAVGTSPTVQLNHINQKGLAAASLYVDYIYLDTEERRRFAQVAHEYLIEQLQYTGQESVTSSSNKISMSFNHPVKELIWVVQSPAFKDCTSRMNLPFNYTTVSDGCNPMVGGKIQLNGHDRFSWREGAYFSKVQPFQHHTGNPNSNNLGSAAADPNIVSDFQTRNLTFTKYRGYADEAGESYGNTALTPVAPVSWVDTSASAYVWTGGRGDAGINVYSFALKPEDLQPSGSCNFSRIDNAVLHLVLKPGTFAVSEDFDGNATSADVRIYAVNYNVLRIMSGMGGLAYSN